MNTSSKIILIDSFVVIPKIFFSGYIINNEVNTFRDMIIDTAISFQKI